MSREHRYQHPHKPETPLTLKTAELTDEILKNLCNEKVFPKRSRWIISGKIADLANDYETAIDEANAPKVETLELRDRRYDQQQIALGKLEALEKKITKAKRVLDINPDRLEHIAGLIIENRKLLQSWVNSDKKRYGPPSGLNNTEDIS